MIKGLLIAFVKQYGNVAIFAGLVLEYLGLPVPGETLMSFLGFLNWKSSTFPFGALVSAVAGTFTGSTLAWLIGYRYGETAFLKYGHYVHITKEKLDSIRISFNKHRGVLLVFGRFVPGVRHIVPYISGISKLNLRIFLLYNLVGSMLWCTSFIGLGFWLGEKWTVVESLIKAYSLVLISLGTFVYIVFKYFNKHKKTIFAISFPLLLFIKLSEDLIKNELSIFDSTIYHWLIKVISEDMTDFMRFMSFAGAGPVLIFISLLCALVLWKKKKHTFYSKAIIINLVAVTVLNEAFKVVFHRERPDFLRLVEAGGFSFPSGHSMIGLSFYGFLAYLSYIVIKSRWKYLIVSIFSIIIVLIGISRIYLGVHYASDVLAGFSAGLAWLCVFITCINKLYRRKPVVEG